MLTPCKDIEPFEGKYVGHCKIVDGQKYNCVDRLLEDIENERVIKIFWTIITEGKCLQVVDFQQPGVQLTKIYISYFYLTSPF